MQAIRGNGVQKMYEKTRHSQLRRKNRNVDFICSRWHLRRQTRSDKRVRFPTPTPTQCQYDAFAEINSRLEVGRSIETVPRYYAAEGRQHWPGANTKAGCFYCPTHTIAHNLDGSLYARESAYARSAPYQQELFHSKTFRAYCPGSQPIGVTISLLFQ